jgi:hypothetical protein
MSEQYGFYKSVNNQELEASYHRDNNFITSIRGIKVRGVFDTIEEAKNRSEFIKKLDSKFNIYIAQVGCWCPWSPNPDCLENQEYAETQLNTLMKEYKKNMNDKDVVFENRKTSLFNSAANQAIPEEPTDAADASEAVDGEVSAEAATEVVVGTDAEGSDATADPIEMSELKNSIEQVDAWSAQKLGIE